MLWVRRLGAPTNARIFGNANDCVGGGWHLETTNGAVSFVGNAQYGVVATPAIPSSSIWDGAWHQLAVSYRATEARMYLDGALTGNVSGAGQLVYPAGSPYGVTVGSSQAACDTAHPDIDVDDVRLYGEVLSDAELQYLASPFHLTSPALPTQGLTDDNVVTKLHLDAVVDNAEVLDSSGHGRHGRGVQATERADGRFGKGLGFTAQGDGFLVPGAGHEKDSPRWPGCAAGRGAGQPDRGRR